MKEFGSWFFVFGIVATVFNAFNINFLFVSWIENWGETVSFCARYGLIIVGALMWLKGRAIEQAIEAEKKAKLNRFKY